MGPILFFPLNLLFFFFFWKVPLLTSRLNFLQSSELIKAQQQCCCRSSLVESHRSFSLKPLKQCLRLDSKYSLTIHPLPSLRQENVGICDSRECPMTKEHLV